MHLVCFVKHAGKAALNACVCLKHVGKTALNACVCLKHAGKAALNACVCLKHEGKTALNACVCLKHVGKTALNACVCLSAGCGTWALWSPANIHAHPTVMCAYVHRPLLNKRIRRSTSHKRSPSLWKTAFTTRNLREGCSRNSREILQTRMDGTRCCRSCVFSHTSKHMQCMLVHIYTCMYVCMYMYVYILVRTVLVHRYIYA
jgi:hypothetical protein